MKELFKDYGAAIGPGLAFLFALVTLFLKQWLDRYFARRDADRRIDKVLELLKESPPPRFEGPPSALSHTADVLTNAVNMHGFLDRVAVIKAALDAAEKVVHEHGRSTTILKYQKIRQELETISYEKTFFRGSERQPIPIEENFFNIEQAWRAALNASESTGVMLTYRRSTPTER